MPFVENNSWSFNITDPQNWTNITVVAQNPCKTVSVPVYINHSSKFVTLPNQFPVGCVLLCSLIMPRGGATAYSSSFVCHYAEAEPGGIL